ncbi:hypothetical protein MLP_25350 [Microlunatus phosphovorus NM-1]|uniref:Uncharacterized protein n=1 Tax=Microlunatus phosphovorus (strain ATCC 700054 / DSM 10555 / JCM 9379 / NBRC 101784 / NCIMB 13414 / VKM Ac-1990 / NM-1) TaxID=1032480 RepID=F5XGR7_MICPN|nr:hypothetical protein MLP_25350 [Microlunatus phosphovorus NM-1]
MGAEGRDIEVVPHLVAADHEKCLDAQAFRFGGNPDGRVSSNDRRSGSRGRFMINVYQI